MESDHIGEHTRNRIFGAAKAIFLKRGFNDASMRDIAREAGTSLANLYNYFPSKEALFAAVTLPARTSVLNMASFISCTGKGELLTCLKEYLVLMSQDQDIYRLLLDSHDGAPQKTFRNEFVQVLTRQAKSCNVDRIVSDAFLHLYAEVTLVLLEELLRTGIISREADELLAEYCSFVYSGWKGLAGQ